MGQFKQPHLLTGTRQGAVATGSRILVALLIGIFGSSCANPQLRGSHPELADRWRAASSEYQRAVLADGTVSAAEYERAVVDTAVCMNQAGFETSALRDVPDGVRKDFAVHQSEGSDAQPDEAWARCWEEFAVAVESVYLAQHASTKSDETIDRQLTDCLADNGLSDVPTQMTDFELFSQLREADASTAAWFCREKWLIARGEMGADPP